MPDPGSRAGAGFRADYDKIGLEIGQLFLLEQLFFFGRK